MKNTYFKVLDDGFVALKDYMGSDEDIEQAARVSYGKGTRKISDTRNLLRYLMRHHHSTPFEMAELKFHIRAPIYVIRQWHRHRTWSYNEYSGRYSEMIDSCQKTNPDEWRTQSQTNKQGSEGFVTEWPQSYKDVGVNEAVNPAIYLSEQEDEFLTKSRKVYEARLEFGIAKEQARKDLPVSNYTEMYAKVDLKNLFHFLGLRCDSHAQLEIRQYANIMASMVQELFPISFEAWYDYQFMSDNWTRYDKLLLNHIHNTYGAENDFQEALDNEGIKDQIDSFADSFGMSKREVSEFWSKLEVQEQKFELDYNNLYDIGNKE